MRRALLIVALLAGATFASAQSLTFPQQTGRVTDEAGILDSATRAALVQKLAALEAKTADQLFVATVKSLQGTSVEDYANRLFRQWGVGQKGKNNGVLLLVAPTERKVRIEVGYGLEGTLTDAVTKLIIENSIVPRFRADDFPGGIARGVDNLVGLLSGDGGVPNAAERMSSHDEKALYWVGGFLSLWLLGAGWIVHLIVRSHRRSSGSRRRGGYLHATSSASSSSWAGSGSSWSSSSSSSSDSSSGGGGDSGGGGSSGSW
jgi:uncharacterized protein